MHNVNAPADNDHDDHLDNNESIKNDNDNKSSNQMFSSSDIEDEVVLPLPSTHDFVAALVSNANQGISNKDSQLTTLSI
jgi:hypothetical protein